MKMLMYIYVKWSDKLLAFKLAIYHVITGYLKMLATLHIVKTKALQ